MPSLPGQRPTIADGQPATETTGQPARPPLYPAHPDAPSQPVLVADALTGTPTWIYPSPPPAAPQPKVDPWAQRILAAGGVSPLVGWAGAEFFGAMAGASTAIGYTAACLFLAWIIRAGGGKATGVNVNVRIENRN
jgi:hypothetical protein